MVATLTANANEQTVAGMVRTEDAQLDNARIAAKAGERIHENIAQQIKIAKRLLLMLLSTFSKMTEVVRDGVNSMKLIRRLLIIEDAPETMLRAVLALRRVTPNNLV